MLFCDYCGGPFYREERHEDRDGELVCCLCLDEEDEASENVSVSEDHFLGDTVLNVACLEDI